MKISTREQDLRMRAAQSAIASARLDGHEPSEMVKELFEAWAKGATTLDVIRNALIAQSRSQHG